MTIINPNSIAGITSLTAEADVMNFYRSNGTLGSLQLNGCNFNTTNGISTFNNLNVGGTLTYEDVKNVDSVGIISARTAIHVGAGISAVGIITATSYRGDGSQLTGITQVGGGTTVGFDDNKPIYFGSEDDYKMYWNGTRMYFEPTSSSTTQQLEIVSNDQMWINSKDNGLFLKSANQNVIDIYGGGGGGVYFKHNNIQKLKLEGGNWTYLNGATVTHVGDTTWDSSAGADYDMQWTTANGQLRIKDSGKLVFGSSGDVSVFHDDSNFTLWNTKGNSYIQNTGDVYIRTNNTENSIKAIANGAVELYHDNAKKLETASWGVDITGDCRASELKLEDGNYLSIGSGNDLRLRHDGTNSVITSSTGSLKILGSEIKFMNAAGTQNGIIYTQSGSVQLYHNNNEMFYTSASGCHVGRPSAAAHLHFLDGGIARFGSSNDLEIYHDASHSRIKTSSSATGNLVIDSNNDINLRVNNSEMSVHCKENGAVELYHDNSKKFETTSGGVGVTGSINAAGATFGDYNVETNRTSGSSKGFYAKRGGVTCSVLSNHGSGPEGKMELYNNGTLNYSAHGTAGTLALNGYIRFGISNGSGNQLDDYEEGSFTPQPWSAAGSISYSHAGDARQGRYTKIGNLVYFVIRLQMSSVSTANGQAFIIGLPFTASSRTGSVDSCHAFNINFYEGIGGLGGDTSITGRVASGQSYILLQKKGDGSSASSYSANDWSGNWSIYGSGCYHTDS